MSDDIPDAAMAYGSSGTPTAVIANPDIPSEALLGYRDIPDTKPSPEHSWAEDQAALESDPGPGEAVLHAITGMGSSLVGGLRYALGADRNLTEAQIERNKQSIVYQPRTPQGQAAASALDTAGGYLGATEGKWLGPRATDLASSLGASARVAGGVGAAADTLANVPQFLVGALKGRPYSLDDVASGEAATRGPVASPPTVSEPPRVAAPRELTATGAPRELPAGLPARNAAPLSADSAERLPYFDINDRQAAETLGIKPEKTETPASPESTGNLSADQQAQRVALAQRVGLTEVRRSAIEGNAQEAADDFDASKYTDSPMGQRMRPVIQAERQALADHASRIIDDLGAREGSDQSTLIAKGKTVAKPFDMLRDHIENETSKAYETAKAQMGDTPVQLPALEQALKDPTLTNQLLAAGKENFLKATQSQLDHFKATNPQGLTVGIAEQYRQFLNTLWQSNSHAVGVLKDALDSDVAGQVGTDVFGPARQLHQLGKVLLDNPKGVSTLFEKDPHTPANRRTSLEDIPDKLANLDGGQFKNVVNTLKMMPEEIQPAAQAALAEIQGHMVNRLRDAGAKSDVQWNKKGVNNELANNSENFKTAFADNPAAAAKIKDLKDAGEMLRINSAYRGAHAQASNMLAKGVGAGAEWAGAGVGAAAGTFMAGPGIGSGVGAMMGKAAVGKGIDALGRAKLNRTAEARIVKVQ